MNAANAEERSAALDVHKTIAEIRTQRAFMVQTDTQYLFCYVCVLDGLRAMLDDANRDKWAKEIQVREAGDGVNCIDHPPRIVSTCYMYPLPSHLSLSTDHACPAVQESFDKAKQSQAQREATDAAELAKVTGNPKGLSDVTAATAISSPEEIKARGLVWSDLKPRRITLLE